MCEPPFTYKLRKINVEILIYAESHFTLDV